MSDETKVVLNHLLEYLQDKIDTGYHKIFYNDDMHDEKTIDCINAINNTLGEIERLNNIIKRLEEDLREMYLTFGEFSEEYTENRIKELKGEDKE